MKSTTYTCTVSGPSCVDQSGAIWRSASHHRSAVSPQITNWQDLIREHLFWCHLIPQLLLSLVQMWRVVQWAASCTGVLGFRKRWRHRQTPACVATEDRGGAVNTIWSVGVLTSHLHSPVSWVFIQHSDQQLIAEKLTAGTALGYVPVVVTYQDDRIHLSTWDLSWNTGRGCSYVNCFEIYRSVWGKYLFSLLHLCWRPRFSPLITK